MRRHAIVVGSLTLVGAAIALLREQATAYWFGAGPSVDAFVIAYALPTFVVNTAAGALGPVFTPMLLKVRHDDGPIAADRFAADIRTANAIVGTAVALLLAATGPWVLRALAPGFDAERLAIATQCLYLLLPAVVLGNVSYFWAALLNADRRFAAAAFAPALPALGGLIALVLFGTRFGVRALAVGVTLGTAAQALGLALAARQAGRPSDFRWPRWSSRLGELAAQYGALVVGAVVLGSTTLVSQAMATSVSPGAVAQLNFAAVPVLFVVGLGARVVGQVLLPHFSALAAERRWTVLRDEATRSLRLVALLSLPAIAVLLFAAEAIVRLLFERGAFAAADTAVVADLLRLLALQVPWYVGGIVAARLLTALQQARQMLAICIGGLGLTIILNVALRPAMGVRGIALAISLVYFATFVVAWWLAVRRLRTLEATPGG